MSRTFKSELQIWLHMQATNFLKTDIDKPIGIHMEYLFSSINKWCYETMKHHLSMIYVALTEEKDPNFVRQI